MKTKTTLEKISDLEDRVKELKKNLKGLIMKKEDMKIEELRVGMRLDARQRRYDFREWMRIEYVAFDWAVARDNENSVHLLAEGDSIDLYKEPNEEDRG